MTEKVEVIVGPIRSRIPDLSPALKSMLYDAMAIPIKGARFSPQVRQGLWDGKIRFFGINGGFATGLLDHVQALLNGSGIELDPVDDRRVIIPTPRIPELPPLIAIDPTDPKRDYQRAIVPQAITRRRGIIMAAVNAGKTIIAAEIIRQLRVTTLYVVPTKELYKQFMGDAKRMMPGMPVGEIRDEGTFQPALLTVCMIQSLVKQIERAWETDEPRRDPFLRWLRDDVEMVFADEGHHFKGKKWGQCFTEAKRAVYRFCLSATPLGGDKVKDMTLIGFTGSVFGNVTTKDLIKRGLSVPTTVRMITYEKTGGSLDFISTSGFFSPGGLYERGICEYPLRATSMYRALRPHLEHDQRVLVFVDRVDHGDFLEYLGKSMYGAAKYSPQFMHGEQDMFKRSNILSRFTKGERPLLIATVLKEGVNIPEIDVIVNACGLESPTKAKQQAGRILRTRKGKTQAIIYDFMDGSHERLLDHTSGRLGAYREEGYAVELVKYYQGE